MGRRKNDSNQVANNSKGTNNTNFFQIDQTKVAKVSVNNPAVVNNHTSTSNNGCYIYSQYERIRG